MIEFTVIPKKPFGTWQFGKIDVLQGIARFFKIFQGFAKNLQRLLEKKNDFDTYL